MCTTFAENMKTAESTGVNLKPLDNEVHHMHVLSQNNCHGLTVKLLGIAKV